MKIKLTNESLDEISQSIADYHGLVNQLRQLQEEAGELVVAVNHYIRYRDDSYKHTVNLHEEIADVLCLIERVCTLTHTNPAVLESIINIKNSREAERMREAEGDKQCQR